MVLELAEDARLADEAADETARRCLDERGKRLKWGEGEGREGGEHGLREELFHQNLFPVEEEGGGKARCSLSERECPPS